uniref:Fe2OG dioxygenase domain-containing protein n=1 Tax=Ditylum brightwellii TaxID=49249 RepID=A0A7S4RUC8_9STRA
MTDANDDCNPKEDDDTKPIIRPINVPKRCSRYLHPPSKCTAFMIDGLLQQSDCNFLIQKAKAIQEGFHYITEATHVNPDDPTKTYKVQLQNPNPHKLSVFENSSFIKYLWEQKLKPILSSSSSSSSEASSYMTNFINRTNCGLPLGLNPRIRVLKYDSEDNDRFEPHFDATTNVGGDQTSLLTVLIYLNDGGGVDFDGGETFYLNHHVSSSTYSTIDNGSKHCDHDKNEAVKVVPSTGKAVIFEHDLYHSGAPLLWGTKYVMRTDILFASSSSLNDCVGDEQKEENKTNIQTEEDEEESPTTANANIAEICYQLDISKNDQAYLNELGILEITAESFLLPGVTRMRCMLQDGFESMEDVSKLIAAAAKAVADQK